MLNIPVGLSHPQFSNSSGLQFSKNGSKAQFSSQHLLQKSSPGSSIRTSPRATTLTTLQEDVNLPSQPFSHRQITKQLEIQVPPRKASFQSISTSQIKSPIRGNLVNQASPVQSEKNTSQIKPKNVFENNNLVGNVALKRPLSNEKKVSNAKHILDERGFLKSLKYFTEEEEIDNQMANKLAKKNSVVEEKNEKEKGRSSKPTSNISTPTDINSLKPKLNNYLPVHAPAKKSTKPASARSAVWNFDSDEEEDKKNQPAQQNKVTEEKQCKIPIKKEGCLSDRQGQKNYIQNTLQVEKEAKIVEQKPQTQYVVIKDSSMEQNWQKEKEEDQKKISMLQEQVLQLRAMLEKSQSKVGSLDIELKSEKISPDLVVPTQQISLSSLNKDSPFSENDVQKSQTNNFIKTIEALRSENHTLRQANKNLLQFKEAAKRYRDLAKMKTDECFALTEELNQFRSNSKPIPVRSSPIGITKTSNKKNLGKIEGLLSVPKPKTTHNNRIGKSLGSSLSTLNTDIVIETSEDESDSDL